MIINYRRIILRKKHFGSRKRFFFLRGNEMLLMGLSSEPSSLSPFNILAPMCCNISWWLSHFCRLHNLWPLHLIEKESKLIGKAHNSFFSWSQPENCRFLRHKSDNTFYWDANLLRASLHFVIISISQTWKITQQRLTIWDYRSLLCQGKLCETTRKISLNMIYWRCLLFSGTFLRDKKNNSCVVIQFSSSWSLINCE